VATGRSGCDVGWQTQEECFVVGRRRATGPSGTRRVWIVVISAVVVVALVVGGFLLWPKFFGSPSDSDAATGTSGAITSAPSATVPDPAVPKVKLALVALPKPTKAATADGVTKQLAGPAANPLLAEFSGIVLDGRTGKTLWSKDPDIPQLPASTAKLLTGAALLTSVDPNSRFTTKVVAGDTAGEVVLVGGGDVTLSARTENTPTVYPGAAHLSQLVDQLKAKNITVKRIILDTSYWSGPEIAQGWDEADIRGGAITRMQALMVDGDRDDPSYERSPRTGDPAMTAGKAFARLLGTPNLPVVEGPAPPNAQVLAQVQSQPMSLLLSQALVNSDNVLAEALARQASIGRGGPGSFDGATVAILEALEKDLKIKTDGVQLVDGSGLSTTDKVPPSVLAKVLASAVSGKLPVMRSLLAGLPVGGVSGTLAKSEGRFDDAASAAGVGWVRAKTGSVGVTYDMAGYVPSVNNDLLVFAVTSNGVTVKTRSALDAFATALRECGCS
jgi:D-alanyl-D-alanine carboxypeptidase/D-alanyl-D-alanine-endopeptidase (penicillin-binding protein 4)